MTEQETRCEFCRLISEYVISKFCYGIDKQELYDKALQYYRYVKLYESTCSTKDIEIIFCLIKDRK